MVSIGNKEPQNTKPKNRLSPQDRNDRNNFITNELKTVLKTYNTSGQSKPVIELITNSLNKFPGTFQELLNTIKISLMDLDDDIPTDYLNHKK